MGRKIRSLLCPLAFGDEAADEVMAGSGIFQVLLAKNPPLSQCTAHEGTAPRLSSESTLESAVIWTRVDMKNKVRVDVFLTSLPRRPFCNPR